MKNKIFKNILLVVLFFGYIGCEDYVDYEASENGAIKLKGVKYAKWDIPSNNLSIIYNSKKIKLDSIKKNIAELGHDTDKYKARLEVYESLPPCCNYKTNSPH